MLERQEKRPLDGVNIAIFIVLPLIALFAVPAWGYIVGFAGWQWLLALVFLYLNGLSITAGYHRLWAHRAYRAHPALKLFFALWGAGALQNSILIWAADHRRHHRHVDDDDLDPYSASRGLWYSHMGWMMRKNRHHQEDFSNAADLMKDPIVMWQHRHYALLTVIMNLGLPLAIGIWTGDVIGCLLLIGLLRLVVNHQVTFFINSLAHYWGSQPYTDKNSARDNHVLAFLTYGEGYHNFHHIFQSDYRNGVKWYQWDPTKWLIRGSSWLGLASELKRVPGFKIQRALLSMQLERARNKLDGNSAAEPLRESLNRELLIFAESVRRWKELQAERYERTVGELEGVIEEGRQALRVKWEQAAIRTHLKELEYSLRMQRKRVQLLMLQMQATQV